ncbi:MAG TPA: hypothetical protein VFR15_01320 [Chloroflexia bacterium]|nr:hypothetical protein [Chloroflexia bacterium]
MSDTDEWQKSERQRRAGPAHDRPAPHRPGDAREHDRHLTPEEVERIEEQVREEVAAASPAISDS